MTSAASLRTARGRGRGLFVRVAVVAASALLLAFLALPFLALLLRVRPAELVGRLGSPVVVDALLLSLVTSAAATFVVVLLGLPLAYVLATREFRGKRVVVKAKAQPPKIGSAAADWSRWPVGTTFRLLSTGQMYRVDDYGWALAGRNTIDLYMATQAEMNAWGARQEPIQILRWGDSEESLRLLLPHKDYRHIRRMVLELQGDEEAAAQLR